MEQQIRMASRLYECRDSAKFLFGSQFQQKIEWYKAIILKWNKDRKTETLKTVMAICELEVVRGDGVAMMMFLAAAVEIIEPSI